MKPSVLLLITTLFISTAAFCQDTLDFNYKRDFDKILKETQKKDGPIAYEKLFPRFIAGDTTLTNYEVLALQIGYTKDKKYLPYGDIELEREIWKLNEEKNYTEALKKCDILLKNNPYNLLGNREKSYALIKTDKKEESVKYYNKFDLVAACDLSTGLGTSYDNSIFVLSPADGQWIIRLALHEEICKMGSGRDKDGNFHDILGIKFEGQEKCMDLFFNIEHAVKRMFAK